jgi:hypothetical protein
VIIDIPAIHGMEYVYSVIINYIIKYFKWIAFPVEADKQVFVFVLSFALVKPAIVPCRVKRPTYVRFCNVMLESGWVELNGNVHVPSILPALIGVNTSVESDNSGIGVVVQDKIADEDPDPKSLIPEFGKKVL